MADLDPRDQVRAAAMILPEKRKDEQVELDVFMAIFHPGHDRIVLDEEDDR